MAYLLWGLFPLYWKPLRVIPADQIVAYRITLAAAGLVAVGLFTTKLDLGGVFPNRRTAGVHLISALLIAVNWLAFLYAVSVDRVVESSLGYFMTPLVSVVLGMVVFAERLRPLQWVAVGLATLGVVVLTVEAGVVPWIAFTLAGSFGLYGLVRKLSPLPSIEGLTAEVVMLAPVALGFLAIRVGSDDLVVPTGWRLPLLALAGVVTATPLLLFAAAARTIPLSAVGILQYINPLMQFVIGLLAFGETISSGRLVGFAVVWAGLVVFAADGWTRTRPAAAATAPNPVSAAVPAPVQE